MNEQQVKAIKILQLIDLTSLNNDDTNASIDNLIKKAFTKYGNVYSLCVYSTFLPYIKHKIEDKKIKLVTVINFPHGLNDIELSVFETQLALSRGADEVDLVFPYHAFLKGDVETANKMISNVKNICKNKILKVIIESGELKNEKLIKLASNICIENGADFIKTSTGKVPINATLKATEIILNTIKDSNAKCGLKISGGVKSVVEAIKYLDLCEKIMGNEWVTPLNMRFGASGLLGDIITQLNNT